MLSICTSLEINTASVVFLLITFWFIFEENLTNMKFRFLKTALLLFFLTHAACQNSPYDTSTPEKLVTSLGLIGLQPEDHNPLPYFYEKASAEAILSFDQNAEKTLNAFNTFRNLLAAKFPEFVKSNREGKIKVSLDGFAGVQTRNFTYSASMISAQMKERSPEDYEFISTTEPDEEGVAQVTVKIKGKTSTLPLKKTDHGYRIFSTQKQLDQISKSVARIKKMNEVFDNGIALINDGAITKENFEDKVAALADAYFNSFQE